jgi:SNF2 family DNA or RNA helicase
VAILTYLRQSIVCPLSVYAKCYLDAMNMKRGSELSEIIYEELKNLGLESYIQDTESVKSSRVRNVLKDISKHPDENITIFTCYRTSIDILREYIPKERKVYYIDGSMSIAKREKQISEFKEGKGGILLLTYDIGSEGLNLQESSVVILMEVYWNESKEKQAIARVLRSGQKKGEIVVYIETSNTGVELAIRGKQSEKSVVINEMYKGEIKSKVSKMKVMELIKMITMDENKDKIRNIYDVM